MRAGLAWVALAAVVGGCGSSGSSDVAGGSVEGNENPSGGGDTSVVEADRGPDEAMVVSYVDGLTSGDPEEAAAAWDKMCGVDDGDGSVDDRYVAEYADFADELGGIAVVRTSVGPVDERHREAYAGRDPVAVSYWLATGGDEVDGPLTAIVADSGEERGICAFTTPDAADVRNAATAALGHLPQPAGTDLERLLPEPDPSLGLEPFDLESPENLPNSSGGTPDDAEEVAPPFDRAEESTSQAWQFSDWGGVTLSAIRFASSADARAAGRQHIVWDDRPPAETFEIPRVPEAVGVRYPTYGWLGIQPLDTDPYFYEIYLVAGDVHFSVFLQGYLTADDRELAVDLTREIVANVGT